MTKANEYTLVEKPILDRLTGAHGYRAFHPVEHSVLDALTPPRPLHVPERPVPLPDH